MKKFGIHAPALLFMVCILCSSAWAKEADLSFLSFDHEAMIGFDLPFKQYIAAYKKFIEKEKGLTALGGAMSRWDKLYVRAEKQGAGAGTLGRMDVIRGLLVQAHGLAVQDRCDEARELSVPIRTELFELHRSLNILTAEDYMIYLHNGVFHRAEPLIVEKRYAELAMLIPRIEATVARFKNPPKGAQDAGEYAKRYGALMTKVQTYINAIKKVNTYVDPEYGGYMLDKQLEDAHNTAHKKFGAVYLSFPKGMVWPKRK
ncbi:MAG TPA: hypothetical protein ENK96_10835 [Desulfobulbaceae bacterium]|nr:hypothetical protein [Desulfobulbaceae bacterium]